MFIQTEATPNPETLKFIPGMDVMEKGTADFKDADSAKPSPLASALFSIAHVNGVFFGGDYISVTKSNQSEWDTLKPYVLTTIMEHFVAGRPLFEDGSEKTASAPHGHTTSEEDGEIVKTIIELIDTRVRPAVAEDGGDIVFRGFSGGVVQLELYGACSGCPSSTATLKDGIENMLKYYVPEVEEVVAVNG